MKQDNDCQIRIVTYREDGITWYSVQMGFWIQRARRRVWHCECPGSFGTFPTLSEAISAATNPQLVARRDLIRVRRNNPPALTAYGR